MDSIREPDCMTPGDEADGFQARFLAICRQAVATDTRALQQEVAVLTQAMLDGWCPRLDCAGGTAAGLEGAAACRAGYWLTLAAGLSSDPVRAAGLRESAARLRPLCGTHRRPVLRFYPPAPGQPTPGHDELAQDWGLAVGLRPIELLQTLERQRLLGGSPAA
jgi:hypothetical protein